MWVEDGTLSGRLFSGAQGPYSVVLLPLSLLRCSPIAAFACHLQDAACADADTDCAAPHPSQCSLTWIWCGMTGHQLLLWQWDCSHAVWSARVSQDVQVVSVPNGLVQLSGAHCLRWKSSFRAGLFPSPPTPSTSAPFTTAMGCFPASLSLPKTHKPSFLHGITNLVSWLRSAGAFKVMPATLFSVAWQHFRVKLKIQIQ